MPVFIILPKSLGHCSVVWLYTQSQVVWCCDTLQIRVMITLISKLNVWESCKATFEVSLEPFLNLKNVGYEGWQVRVLVLHAIAGTR